MTPRGIGLGTGQEFDLIRQMVERWGDIASGIGDDAAVIPLPRGERMVVSTDAAIERVHFRLEWLSAADVGYRATMAALSDLAAMAATPRGLLVSFVAPRDRQGLLLDFADGIGDAARTTRCPIVGGNVARGTELSITTTVIGSAFAPMARAGARVGQAVYVTGQLGGAAAALRALEAGRTPSERHLQRFRRPTARLSEARWLASRGATACIDISDGLVSDAAHLAAANGLGVEIDADAVPVSEDAKNEDALAGGEEYELLVVSSGAMDDAGFRQAFGIPLTRIGRMTARTGTAEPVVVMRDGKRIDAPKGYDHFSR